MLNQLNEHSFLCLTLITTIFCIFTTNAAARPVSNASTHAVSLNNLADSAQSANASDIQTIVTSQIIPGPDGNTTEVCTFIFAPTTLPGGSESIAVEKNCSFTFTSNFPAATGQSTSTSTLMTTVVQTSTASLTSSTSVSESDVPSTVVSIAPTITLTPAPNPVLQSTPTSTFVSPTFASAPDHVTESNETAPPTSTSASSASQTVFGDSNTGHLSTLPIFLGAFGGVAGIALLVVGCIVYRPLRRLNEWRLNPPSCFVRRRPKPWNHEKMADLKEEPIASTEKLTAMRKSQESNSSAQVSRWSKDSGGLTTRMSP